MKLEEQIICLAARSELSPLAQAELLIALEQQPDWERIWQLCHLHEVLPLVLKSLMAAPQRALIPATWLQRALRRRSAIWLHNQNLLNELEALIARFEQAQIPVIPVKGVVLGQMAYGDWSLRPCADIDILVHNEQLDAARNLLQQRGYYHREQLLFAEAHHPYHDPQYFLDTDLFSICLELHWALWAKRYFNLGNDQLWLRSQNSTIGQQACRILSPEDTLLHLAIHRSRSALRLRFVCDCAELLGRYSDQLDWDYIVQQAQQAGARTALFYALSLPQQLLGTSVPQPVLARLHVSRAKQRLLEHTCGISALFRPAANNDQRQQPHLIYRLLEQDGLSHIASASLYSISRTIWKHSQNRLRQS
jgi:hypothetical protein